MFWFCLCLGFWFVSSGFWQVVIFFSQLIQNVWIDRPTMPRARSANATIFFGESFLVLVVCVFWGWFCLLCFGVRDSLTLCHGKDHCHCIKFLCVYIKNQLDHKCFIATRLGLKKNCCIQVCAATVPLQTCKHGVVESSKSQCKLILFVI